MTNFSIAANASLGGGGAMHVGGTVADAGQTLTFALDTTPSLLADNGDYVAICVARPNAANPIARTLVLPPDQVALLDSYMAQTGAADVIDALFRHLGCLISGMVQSQQTAQQQDIATAVRAALAAGQQE